MIDSTPHPCFNVNAKGSHGRVHLPVAPRCNIKCNYCNRKYDCVNESRPGVTSNVLAPHQAAAYMGRVLEREPRISVAGIAGPGDPMANYEETLETIRLVKAAHPEMLICLSSNGMALAGRAAELAAAGVSHVTVTVNAMDPEIGQRIYAYVRDGKVVYRGKAAAELLLERQTQAVRELKEQGLTVKLNTIVIPGVNDGHVEEVARWGRALGVDLMNLMPLHPNEGTPFGELGEPSRQDMQRLRAACAEHLEQMTHCQRCRADAVGLLEEDRSGEMAGCLSACSNLPKPASDQRPFVAVASREGMLVNLHLGQATELLIFGPGGDGFELIEARPAPPAGGGEARWRQVAELLGDCRALLTSGVGETPRRVLEAAGIQALEMNGFINEGLKAVYGGGDLSAFRVRKPKACCGGGGMGGGDGMGCL